MDNIKKTADTLISIYLYDMITCPDLCQGRWGVRLAETDRLQSRQHLAVGRQGACTLKGTVARAHGRGPTPPRAEGMGHRVGGGN